MIQNYSMLFQIKYKIQVPWVQFHKKLSPYNSMKNESRYVYAFPFDFCETGH